MMEVNAAPNDDGGGAAPDDDGGDSAPEWMMSKEAFTKIKKERKNENKRKRKWFCISLARQLRPFWDRYWGL